MIKDEDFNNDSEPEIEVVGSPKFRTRMDEIRWLRAMRKKLADQQEATTDRDVHDGNQTK